MATKKPDLGRLLDAINKGSKMGRPAARMSAGLLSDVREFIPTGVAAVDRYVIGRGGLPVGRLTELYSEEGAGKSSLALSALAQAQALGGFAIMVETETALETSRAEAFGVDLERLVTVQPAHLGEVGRAVDAALRAIPKGVGPNLLVWDSVAATRSREEAEEGMEKAKSFDTRAKSISQVVRTVCPVAAERRTALLFVNQIRDKIGVLFGPKQDSPGGHTLKFHCALRLQLFPGKKVDGGDGGPAEGRDLTVYAMKNKLSAPFRKTKVRLLFEGRFDDAWSTLYLAKELGLVTARCRSAAEALAALELASWRPPPGKEVRGEAEEAEDPEE